MLDFHNHLMPGVDDGAVDLDESRIGLETLRSQGVRDIITTPHIRASLTERPRELGIFLGVIDESWDRLRSLAEAEFPELRLERGVEIMLDIPHPDLSDSRLRLAGTSFALVEFPFMSIPPHSTRAISEIVERGWTPVIAHPERYSNMPAHYDLVDDWRDAGGLIQVNSGSFLSFYGSNAKRFAWYLFGRGCVDYLSSDYHSRGKCAVEGCAAELMAKGADAQLRALTTTNPERLLRNEAPLPVQPFEPKGRSLWKRLLPWS
jgi:Capsular polysaccharide biosynthesis protein